MHRRVLILPVIALMLALCCSFASAFTMAEKVVVANELIAIARVPAGGLTPNQRIDEINDRLAYIIGFERLTPENITAVMAPGGSRAIMVGRSLLMTVTPADARANGTTVAGLTREWLQNIREILPEARPLPVVTG